MRPITYPAQIQENAPGEFVVTFRDVPEAITSGATREHALHQALDALATAIDGYLIAGRALPEASAPETGEQLVRIDLAR